jgi:hypothetical protein
MATAMLYSYTPHLHGNQNLWRIWQRWFSLTFPDGTFVRGKSSNKIYLVRYGQKKPFVSRAVASSLVDPEKIVLVEDSQLTAYPDGRPIAFPNYALVETPDGKRFLIVGEKRRHIVSMEAWRKFGFNEDEVLEAEPEELDGYEDGPDITTSTVHPTGLLVRDPKGAYWYVEDGVRHVIPHPAFLKLYFRGRPAKNVTQTKVESYEKGDPYRLRNGELVRGPKAPSVFVIENGLRRPIPSAQIFEEMGWKWKNIVTLPESLLEHYPLGDAVQPQPSVHTTLASDL